MKIWFANLTKRLSDFSNIYLRNDWNQLLTDFTSIITISMVNCVYVWKNRFLFYDFWAFKLLLQHSSHAACNDNTEISFTLLKVDRWIYIHNIPLQCYRKFIIPVTFHSEQIRNMEITRKIRSVKIKIKFKSILNEVLY